ncbi:MAG TPA: tryptophan synthase subunit alpha [Gemmatimonadota bacterium]|nr:tryptophan synthase subunit alpha [Gemmatimonadota bacterium]
MKGVAPSRGTLRHLRDTRARGRKLLVPYLTAGYPDRERCTEALAGLADAGADAIELGVPFSDPLADGPVIAAASEQAIAGGTSIEDAFDLAAEYFRAGPDRPPLVLFTYMNPVASLGPDRLADACAGAGIGAVLVADLPYDEDPEVAGALARRGLPLIRLAAPTTPADRLARLASGADGFVYLIARTGTTGAGAGTDARVAEQVAVIRANTDLPVVVGFGIGDPEAAIRAAALADGVVVGSAFVERLGRDGPASATGWIRTLRDALDEPASV